MDYTKFLDAVAWMADAHQRKALPTATAWRAFPGGEKNPFFTHPLWCAVMLLLDTQLPENIRVPGAQALLLHDILEDTSASLPEDITDEVRTLVGEMTYADWKFEREMVPFKPPPVQLLKLYDKTATLYDACAPQGEKLREWLVLTRTLIGTVRRTYGELHIVLLAEALVEKYEVRTVR